MWIVVPLPDRFQGAIFELLQPPSLLIQLLDHLHIAVIAYAGASEASIVDDPLLDEVDGVAVVVRLAAAAAPRPARRPRPRARRQELCQQIIRVIEPVEVFSECL